MHDEKDEPKTSTPILIGENTSLPAERPKISFAIRPHFTTRLSGVKTFNGRLMTPISSLIDDDSDSDNGEVNQDKVQREDFEIESNGSTTILSNLTKSYEESLKLLSESKSNDEFSEVCDQVGNLMTDWSDIQSAHQDFSFDDQMTEFNSDPLLIDRNERKTTQASWRSLLESIDAGIDDQSRQSPTTEKLMALKQMAKENAGEINDNRESAPRLCDVTSSVCDTRNKCLSHTCDEKSAEKKSRLCKSKNEYKDTIVNDERKSNASKQDKRAFNSTDKNIPLTGLLQIHKKDTVSSSVTVDIANLNTKTNDTGKITDVKRGDNSQKKIKDKKRKKKRKDNNEKSHIQSFDNKEKLLQTEMLLDSTPILENDDIFESSNADSSKDGLNHDTSITNDMENFSASNISCKMNTESERNTQENSMSINPEIIHMSTNSNEADSANSSDFYEKSYNEEDSIIDKNFSK